MRLLVLPVLAAVWLLSQSAQARSPILLINGIVGSTLEARDDRDTFFDLLPHKCNTFGDFKTVWVNLIRLPKCGTYELSLEYDERTNQFSDMPDVEVRAKDFGGTSGVERLGGIPYFAKLVDYFVDRGYERGRSIRAAPYDWRLDASELERRGYFRSLKSLIQQMYHDNGEQRVTLVVHSMGGLVSLHFLTGYSGIDQAWKDAHINAYITLSGAWSGGVAALASVISGKQVFGGFDLLNELLANFLVPIGRTIPSIPWLLPRASVFGDRVLLATPRGMYTAADYRQLFDKIQYSKGYQVYQNQVENITPNYPAPNVPTYCLYGVGVETPEMYIYDQSLEEDSVGVQPSMVVMGDGDGTVNLVSSQVCERWASMSPRYPFQSKRYDGVEHISIVSNDQVIEDIRRIVSPPLLRFNRRRFNRRFKRA